MHDPYWNLNSNKLKKKKHFLSDNCGFVNTDIKGFLFIFLVHFLVHNGIVSMLMSGKNILERNVLKYIQVIKG